MVVKFQSGFKVLNVPCRLLADRSSKRDRDLSRVGEENASLNGF